MLFDRTKRMKRGAADKRRNLSGFLKDRDGVTAIEFGMLAIPFFMIVMAIMEFGLAFLVNRIIDNAVLESARMIRTGEANQSSFSAADFKSNICNNMPSVLCDLDKFVVDVTTASSFTGLASIDSLFDSEGDLKSSFNYSNGSANEIVIVRVIYRWPMFSSILQTDAGDSSGERLLSSTAIFRNEPWPF